MSETEIQHLIVQMYRKAGCEVWITSQGYRRRGGTRVTPGLPDLWVFPRKGSGFWFEVKAPGEKLRDEQRRFRDLCIAHGTRHGWGGLDDALAML